MVSKMKLKKCFINAISNLNITSVLDMHDQYNYLNTNNVPTFKKR